MILVNALSTHPIKQGAREEQVYIITGPVQSGKTTSLIKWAEKRNDVYGILTPVINGKRVFLNSNSGEIFPMEATEDEEETVNIGRFTFSKRNFDKAIAVIGEAIDKPGWLVIDEIGPLELRGEGFATVLKKVLKQRDEKMLLVVRAELVEEVRNYFEFQSTTITNLGELNWADN
jgi:nucleoside-triphosphatase THEP1